MPTTAFSTMMAANQRFFARHQPAVEAAHQRAVAAGVRQPVVIVIDLLDHAGRHLAACLGLSRKVIRKRFERARRDRQEAPLILVLPLSEVEAVLKREAPRAAQWLRDLESPRDYWVVTVGNGGASVASVLSLADAKGECDAGGTGKGYAAP